MSVNTYRLLVLQLVVTIIHLAVRIPLLISLPFTLQDPVKDTQPSLTNRATHLCKRHGVADLLKHAHSRIGYVEFGRPALKNVGINTGDPRKLESAGSLFSWDGRSG